MSFKKNTAVTGFTIGLVSASDGSDITTGTPVGYYTLDGGTQTAIADVSPTHEGNGQWSFDLTAGEMNGDIVGLTFTHASAITQHFTIKTDTKIVSELQDLTAAEINTECDTAISDAALATAANLATVDANVDAILVDTGTALPADIASLNNFDPANDTVANVTLCATVTTNTDMRGTDNAATATSLATAQTDLDTITGSDGVTLATTQGAITWGAVTISANDALNNITLSGAGTGDGLAFTRSGTGDVYDTNWSTAIEQTATDALTAYAPNTVAPDNASITAILTDTGTTLPASIAALPTASEINAEVVDVLETDTHAEPSSSVGATTSIKDAIMWNKTVSRNKMTQTATTTLLRNDSDSATVGTSTVSDDGTTTTRGKFT